MDKMKIGIIVMSVVFTGFAVTWIFALPQPSTPLYTFRMEQASSKMNFLSTPASAFMYTTEKGYTLNSSAAGCCNVLLDTGVWTCYYSTCGGETCILTCPVSCHGTCNDPTCPDTCNPTCNVPTCPNTCGDTHQYTCSTCEETCEHTCPLTCDDPTCLETCSGFTCYETCPETCSPTCIDPTCVNPTCLETCLETCSQEMC